MSELERFTTAEAAARIGISKSTLLRWERTGQIPKAARTKRTNERRYSEADIGRIRAWKETGDVSYFSYPS